MVNELMNMENCQFPKIIKPLHSHRQWVRIPDAPTLDTVNFVLFFFFLILAILLGGFHFYFLDE